MYIEYLVGAERLDQRFQLRDALCGGLHLFSPFLAVPPLRLPIPVLQPVSKEQAKRSAKAKSITSSVMSCAAAAKRAQGIKGMCRWRPLAEGKSALVELSGGLRFFAGLVVRTLQGHRDNVVGRRAAEPRVAMHLRDIFGREAATRACPSGPIRERQATKHVSVIV